MTERSLHYLEKVVLKTIERYRLLGSGDNVVVALSGGPDSVALLLVLQQLSSIYGLHLIAAHMNHQLRGLESDQDEEFVRDLCGRLRVSLHVNKLDTRGEAAKGGRNLEDFARNIRYHFLFDVAQRQNAIVATGHNLDDQAETFLMKLARGAGPAGLSGIYPLRRNQENTLSVTVVRPLLEASRAEILSYLDSKNQSYRMDSTNQDLNLDRNWVRHHLVPMLVRKLNPELLSTLGRTTRLFREIEDFLAGEAKKGMERCRARDHEGLTLDISKLQSFPDALQKEMVRQSIREAKGDLRDISLQHVEDVLQLTHATSGRQVHLPGDLKVQREFGNLHFLPKAGPVEFSCKLVIPGDIYIKEVRKSVHARRICSEKPTAGVTLLQFQGDSLRVRNRRAGDVYSTSAKSPQRKLKKLLIEKRIPRSKRDKLLIFEAASEIAWVEGFPPAPQFQPMPGASSVVEIRVCLETFSSESESK